MAKTLHHIIYYSRSTHLYLHKLTQILRHFLSNIQCTLHMEDCHKCTQSTIFLQNLHTLYMDMSELTQKLESSLQHTNVQQAVYTVELHVGDIERELLC